MRRTGRRASEASRCGECPNNAVVIEELAIFDDRIGSVTVSLIVDKADVLFDHEMRFSKADRLAERAIPIPIPTLAFDFVVANYLPRFRIKRKQIEIESAPK